eukprot:Phypoly_transcript_12822.p1 GENE.Phypoly_transcript_12822~~Phypoly_transcript_12822.p1  ORF type:complete len:262 (+),score=19.84 Phypoly_transcript_12822:216-1001(+)
MYHIYAIVKWFPQSLLHKPWVIDLESGSSACKFGVFVNNFTVSGLVACDTLIALTLFLMIKMKVDMELNQQYYYRRYLSFAIGFPLVVGLISAFGFETSVQFASTCIVVSPIGEALVNYPNILLVIFQFILLMWAMTYARHLVSSIQSINPTQFPIMFLIVRFMATFVAQLYTIVGTQIYALSPGLQSNGVFSRFAFTSHLTGGTIDALILIVGNVDFVNWVTTTFEKYRRRYSTSSQISFSETELVASPQVENFEMASPA